MKSPMIYVLLINVDVTHNARNICETLEGQTFQVPFITTTEVLHQVINKFPKDLCVDSNIMLMELSDFTTMCNNEEVNMDQWFMGYVYAVEQPT